MSLLVDDAAIAARDDDDDEDNDIKNGRFDSRPAFGRWVAFDAVVRRGGVIGAPFDGHVNNDNEDDADTDACNLSVDTDDGISFQSAASTNPRWTHDHGALVRDAA